MKDFFKKDCICLTQVGQVALRTVCAFVGIFIAPAYSKVRYRGSTFRPFVRSFVRPSTIYVKVLTL